MSGKLMRACVSTRGGVLDSERKQSYTAPRRTVLCAVGRTGCLSSSSSSSRGCTGLWSLPHRIVKTASCPAFAVCIRGVYRPSVMRILDGRRYTAVAIGSRSVARGLGSALGGSGARRFDAWWDIVEGDRDDLVIVTMVIIDVTRTVRSWHTVFALAALAVRRDNLSSNGPPIPSNPPVLAARWTSQLASGGKNPSTLESSFDRSMPGVPRSIFLPTYAIGLVCRPW
jgi:hypothetical protein